MARRPSRAKIVGNMIADCEFNITRISFDSLSPLEAESCPETTLSCGKTMHGRDKEFARNEYSVQLPSVEIGIVRPLADAL